MPIKDPKLLSLGLIIVDCPLPSSIKTMLDNQQWQAMDQLLLEMTKPRGELSVFLSQFVSFNHCEHIIAIRSAPLDEEGIWHDDGSRLLGFSLSLNLEPTKIRGGELRFRKKGQTDFLSLSPLPYGKMAIFLSGLFGYEHQVGAVLEGQRVVIAGWCS